MQIDADKIRLIVAKQGSSLSELARISGVSRQTVSTTMTRGTCRPETAIKLSEALGIEPESILRSANP